MYGANPVTTSITITGKTADGNLNLKNIDIAETKELLTDMETLLFHQKQKKMNAPK